jgi:hypothetical protein
MKKLFSDSDEDVVKESFAQSVSRLLHNGPAVFMALTKERLIGIKRAAVAPGESPFVAVKRVPENIVFDLPLTEIQSVQHEKFGLEGHRMLIKRADGTEVRLLSAHASGTLKWTEEWVGSVQQAVTTRTASV